MGKSIDFSRWEGIKHDGLTFLKFSHYVGTKAYVLTRCDCGSETIMQWANFNRNKSCGCSRTEKIYKYSGHRLYTVWKSMKARINNQNNPRYNRYGGRGIKICDRWYNYDNFCEDVIEGYKEGLQLDRYPNKDGDYEPSNFRWATPKMNMRNRDGLVLNDDKAEEIRNSKLPLRELMKLYGASKSTIIQTRSGRIWQQ